MAEMFIIAQIVNILVCGGVLRQFLMEIEQTIRLGYRLNIWIKVWYIVVIVLLALAIVYNGSLLLGQIWLY